MRGVQKPAARKTGRKAPRDDRQGALAAFIDHCHAAQAIANEQGETFLSYLIAVTLLAAMELQQAP